MLFAVLFRVFDHLIDFDYWIDLTIKLRLISSTDQRSKRLARFEGRKITSQS